MAARRAPIHNNRRQRGRRQRRPEGGNLQESYHPIDSPFVHEITQEQAARWYEEGDYLGAGVMGEAHKYKVPESELTGGPWVMIKNFKRKL